MARTGTIVEEDGVDYDNTYRLNFMGNSDLSLKTNTFLAVEPLHLTTLNKKNEGEFINKRQLPRTDDTAYLSLWINPTERSAFTFELYSGYDNAYIMRHQYHGWARSQKKSIEDFESNSWVGVSRELESDRRDDES